MAKKSQTKKDRKEHSDKKNKQIKTAYDTLDSLAGKDIDKLSDIELRKFLRAVGCILRVSDDKGKIIGRAEIP